MEQSRKRTFDDVQLSFWLSLIEKHQEKIAEAKARNCTSYVIKTTSKNADDLIDNTDLIQELSHQLKHKIEVSHNNQEYYISIFLPSPPKPIAPKSPMIMSKMQRELIRNDIKYIATMANIFQDKLHEINEKLEKGDAISLTHHKTELAMIADKLTNTIKVFTRTDDKK